jgi:hypothetical protein
VPEGFVRTVIARSAFAGLVAAALFVSGCGSDESPAAPGEAAVQDAAGEALDASFEPSAFDAEPDVVDAAEDVSDAATEEAVHLNATGFFHAAQAGGRWWIVTPDGKPFFSLGVNHVTAASDTDRKTGQCPYCEAVAKDYPSTDAWADASVQRLESWGFNTIGAWSDTDTLGKQMPYTVLLDLGSGTSDYFSPDFATHCADVAASRVAPLASDPNLLGWFLDNELHWGPDWRDNETLLADYLKLPAGSPGLAIAESYHGDAQRFLAAVAERYFEVTTSAIRAVDPNHMILGCRIISVLAPAAVVQAAAPWVDVFSVNNYEYNPGLPAQLAQLFPPVLSTENWLADFYALVKRPILISEFSDRAADSGLPNDDPPIFPVLKTQQDRADAYEKYTDQSYAAPYVVGEHWFEFTDEPAGGRFDGEDSNFGLVSVDDAPYATLVQRMTQVNAQAPSLLVKTD